MIEWIKADSEVKPIEGNMYLLFVPENETGEFIPAKYDKFEDEPTESYFWDEHGSEVQNFTHYAEINTP